MIEDDFERTAALWHYLGIYGRRAAFVLAAAAIILFIYFKIPEIYDELRGMHHGK